MDLAVFSVRDLSIAVQIMTSAEKSGVMDLPQARLLVSAEIDRARMDASAQYRETVGRKERIELRTRMRAAATSALMPCPSCASGRMVPIQNDEGLKILGCKKCRLSMVVDK
jgi:hypothetical protein